MTTVVACANTHGVWMAADTMTNIYDRPIYGFRKIRRITVPGQRDILIGLSGDGALGDMIAHRVAYPAGLRRAACPTGPPDLDAWATQVAIAISTQAVTEGLVDDGRLGGNLILGAAGRLWTLVHMQAVAHTDGMAAIGTGEGPAIGALQALLRLGEKPAFAVGQACEIGIDRDRYSGGDVTIEHIEVDRMESA